MQEFLSRGLTVEKPSAMKSSHNFTNLDYKDVANLYAEQTVPEGNKSGKMKFSRKHINCEGTSKIGGRWEECRKAESDCTNTTGGATLCGVASTPTTTRMASTVGVHYQ